ncbi:23S rRNA (guanosine(2251)-2'-O)-methyltransferase RlmB [Bernardetia sp. Wsw4-3y2]|uniref:23S rRNA (guanosine(2251)-2'-O)-methyltransferase RlmB n=1 Tax=unclassified Bernardetia TaxID=2647129 RepID=UPI0030CD2E1C
MQTPSDDNNRNDDYKDSKSNFKEKKDYTHSRQNRNQRQTTSNFIFGWHPVLEALRSDKTIDKILVEKDFKSEEMTELMQLVRKQSIYVQRVPVEKLNRVTRKAHQGVVAFVSEIDFVPLENIVAGAFEAGKNPLILILDRITDVRNFGAIVRSAECTGVDGIVVPTRLTAQMGADAVKTSAGALMHMPICRYRSLVGAVNFLKESGLKVVACTEKTDKQIYDLELDMPLAIVMGSEEVGISEEVLEVVDERASLPMVGKVGSLNVSVATGVALYEVVRQKSITN